MARILNLSKESMPQASSHINEKTILSLVHRWLVEKKKSYCSKKLERKWTLTKWLISKGTFLISFLFWESRQELILAGG